MSESRAARTARTVALVAAGALGATALTGVAFAAGSPGSVRGAVTPAGAPSDALGMGPGMGPGVGPGMGPGMGMMRGGRLGAGLGQPLHGEGTFRKADGTVVTARFQSGTVTANAGGTLSVKSDDGYAADWSVGASATVRRDRATVTVDKIAVGDHVMVVAEVTNGTTTVTRVMAFSPQQWTTMQERRAEIEKRLQERRANGGGSNGGAPATPGS